MVKRSKKNCEKQQKKTPRNTIVETTKMVQQSTVIRISKNNRIEARLIQKSENETIFVFQLVEIATYEGVIHYITAIWAKNMLRNRDRIPTNMSNHVSATKQ